MAQGYEGTYRGSVLDDVDPLGRNRLRVLVPEIYGEDALWAEASLPSTGEALRMPGVGDEVWVSFERGDTDAPVWELTAVDAEPEGGTARYPGRYRGVVIDDADPQAANRLQLSVPEVLGTDAVWATVAASAWNGDDLQVPSISDEVWVEFENGDPLHPTWVGLAHL